MIDMIRVGQTRNLLRASSSLLEIWPRSAHHHPGQRHLSGRANRPDKSPHSITCLMFRNSLQMRAASTREGWMLGPSPPPLSNREPDMRPLTGPFFFLFQRGLAKPSDLRRLAVSSKSVSERPASLSIRPSTKSRRVWNWSPFQTLGENGLRRSCGDFVRYRCKLRHPKAA